MGCVRAQDVLWHKGVLVVGDVLVIGDVLVWDV